MHLTGNKILNASTEKIWNILMDADMLAKITPAVSRLEPLGNDTYKAIADVKIGPVKGSFSGNLSVLDKIDHESFMLRVNQNSKIGNVAADVKIYLKAISDTQTEMSFAGDAKMSGLLAATGQRVVSGVANMLTEQFFEALEKEL
jgi:carbon monoxide dehydrogenase subunit G